jgi:3D (Asp-Asp-Asp) domain-containing protein
LKKVQFSLLLILTVFTLAILLLIGNFADQTKELNSYKEQVRELKFQLQSSQQITKDYIKELNDKLRYIKQLEQIPKGLTIKAKVTAYAPNDNKSGICNDGDILTSTGKIASRGMVAVDPKKIPYGTKLYIPGYGIAEAQDTGGAIRAYDGVQIDIVMDSYEEAIEWGVRYLDVTFPP